MEYIKISESNTFSRIVQGFWRLTDWNMTTEQLIDFMKACIDMGVTTFDTAEIYADTECERQMGLAFKQAPELRSQIQLVSKTGIFKTKIDGAAFGYYNTSYERVIKSCKESLKRLNCEYLDLYLIHREDPCIDHHETSRALLDLKKEGLVKDIGASNFDPFKFNALNKCTGGALVTNQIEWNPCCFEHFNSGMMDVLVQEKIKPMIWSPLAGGKLFTSEEEIYERAIKKIQEIAIRHEVEAETIVYAWILFHPIHALPIVGSGKLSRLVNAVEALEISLEHSEWYEIYAASGQQKIR